MKRGVGFRPAPLSRCLVLPRQFAEGRKPCAGVKIEASIGAPQGPMDLVSN
jgi:hypothetical protein